MIYCVEDDSGIRELIVYTLENSGYEAAGFEEGGSFFKALDKKLPSLILLDIMLPGEDGIQLLKRIRETPATKAIPVIMLTAKGAEYDKVVGLNTGADDYMTKPFGMMELLARIKAVLRRTGTSQDVKDPSLAYANVEMDELAHRVLVDHHLVDLTLKEYNLLKLLLSNVGRVLTRDTLLSQIWGYDFDGETRTVDVHIRTLRQKLGDTAPIIETVRGVGYRIGGRQ